jgi:cytoskeletal protein RodZ
MANFGEALRKERESRGIALDSVVGATKISLRHLHAIESDRFDDLPGGVFNKGIVRNYARTLGLDENEWVARYMKASRQSDNFDENDLQWTAFAENVGRARGKDTERSDTVIRWAGVFVLLLFLCGLSWFVWDYVHHKNLIGKGQLQDNSLALRDVANP